MYQPGSPGNQRRQWSLDRLSSQFLVMLALVLVPGSHAHALFDLTEEITWRNAFLILLFVFVMIVPVLLYRFSVEHKARLKASRQLFDATATANTGLIQFIQFKNNKLSVEFMNFQAQQLSGLENYTHEPLDQLVVFDSIVESDVARVTESFKRSLSTGEHFHEIFQYRFPNGEEGWLLAEAQSYGFNGKTRFWNLCLYDHTHTQDLDEKLNRVLIARDDFVTAAGHDLRTPIQNVSLALQSINKDLLSEPDRKRLIAASTAASDLEDLVDDFMEVSTMNSDTEALRREAFDLQDLVSSVCRSFIGVSQAKNLRYEQSYQSNVPRYVSGDALRIKQILYNIVGNAFKYTQSGTVSVIIRLGDSERFQSLHLHSEDTQDIDLTVIDFVVTDSGAGIPARQLPHIFEPFATAEPFSRKSSGLGLAICERLVSLMNGKITVDTQEGSGSTFIVSIPFDANQLPDAKGIDTLSATSDLFGDTLAMTQTLNTMVLDEELLAKPPVKNQQIADSKKLLVVDDNYMVCEMLASLLALEGWEVMQADSGTEALAILAEHEFRAVITDHKMPYMTGLELGQMILESYKSRGWRPVLIIMSGGMPRDSKDAANECFDVVLTKPVRAREIHEAIKRLSMVSSAVIS